MLRLLQLALLSSLLWLEFLSLTSLSHSTDGERNQTNHLTGVGADGAEAVRWFP